MSAVAAARPLPVTNALRARLRTAAEATAYLAAAAPLAVVELFALLAAVVSGPHTLARVAALERRLANTLLRARVPPLAHAPLPRLERRNVLAFLALRLPVAMLAAVAVILPLGTMLVLASVAAEGYAGSDRFLGPWRLDGRTAAALTVLAAAAAVVSVGAAEGAARPLRALVRRFLIPVAHAETIREALAERIGDETLSIVYWLPDRDVYVDEHGVPVELPSIDSGRAATIVEHDGRRVAAVIHGAALDARPELIQAAAVGSVLALDNERLKADLRARVEELRASRARIVQASIEARRKLERDLHDGAQQQLVSLALDLQLLRSHVADEAAAQGRIDAAVEKVTTALEDLRELARGIHPAILTNRGLGPAVEALVDRTPVPFDVEIELEERVASAAEAAAYFVVAEALTNVAKYAHAKRGAVRVRRDAEAIVVEVEDDGIGGADARSGSGLRGLDDRVAALDGTLSVWSPPGSGTRVTARIPADPA